MVGYKVFSLNTHTFNFVSSGNIFINSRFINFSFCIIDIKITTNKAEDDISSEVVCFTLNVFSN